MSMIDPMTGLPTPVRFMPQTAPLPTTVAPIASPLTGGGGGLGSLPGAQGGVLARGLPPVTPQVTTPLTQGAGLAGRVPVGAGASALDDALRLAGGTAAGGTRAAGGLGARAASAASAARSGGGVLRSLPGAIRANPRGALGWGALGTLGSAGIDRLNVGGDNSVAEQFLEGAAQGGGIGAVAGPKGALVTGLVGGSINVLANMFGGGGDDPEQIDPIEVINNAVNTAQLDPAAEQEIMTTYAVLMDLAQGAPDDETRAALEMQALDAAGNMVLEALQTRDAVSQQANNTMALQAQAAEVFAPLAQDIEASTLAYAQAMEGIRGNLPPEFQGIADMNVAREMSASQRLADAYRAQAQITPIVNQLTQYQQDFNNYAAQQFSQAMAQGLAGGGTSLGPSANDVQALLAAGV